MGEELMINAFRRLRASTTKNKTERLRKLYDEVAALKACGFTHAEIVETMKNEDLDFKSVSAFEVTLYRIKKERANSQVNTGETQVEAKAVGAALLQKQKDEWAGRAISPAPTAEQKQAESKGNPLHVLGSKPTQGDFNHIPKAKFEVDNS